MALMFDRLAHNYAQDGYYRTDDETVKRCAYLLDSSSSKFSLLDPCCGEGLAVADVVRQFEQSDSILTHGVEINRERYLAASDRVNQVVHSDLNEVNLSLRAYGLLWLNPPYGQIVTDKAGLGNDRGTDRLEKVFFRRTISTLQADGIMVLIIPYYVLDKEFSLMITKWFYDVQAYMAPEQQFKQCVIVAKKRASSTTDAATAKRLEAIGGGQLPPELPDYPSQDPYLIPEMRQLPIMRIVRLEPEQLVMEIKRHNKATLWGGFDAMFGGLSQSPVPKPLRDLTQWHLALALAAGYIEGIVNSDDGRTLFIKGNTFKEKDERREMDEDGNLTITRLDRFVPIIKGIELTPGDNYGRLVTIR